MRKLLLAAILAMLLAAVLAVGTSATVTPPCCL
jgi:hypothetical protein